MNLNRLLTVTKKEFIHIKRDKPSLIMALIAPIMMLLVFGFAVTSDVKNVNLGVIDYDNSQLSRDLVTSFSNADFFTNYGSFYSYDEVKSEIEKDKVKVALVIPEDFSRKIYRNEQVEIQIIVDGSDPTIARVAYSNASLIVNSYISSLNPQYSSRIVVAKPYILYNPAMESAKFNVPGVVGLILQNITIILTSFAMVRERERGTIEQLIMTPITSLELIIGKLIPYVIIGMYDFFAVLLMSNLIFGVEVAGNFPLLVLLGFIFLIGALATGMLISTFAKNQTQAMQASILFLLPSVLLSGFMFPRSAMPDFVYMISNVIPVTYFLEILRAIILKGSKFINIMEPTAYLLFLITVIIAVTAIKFKKTLE